MKVQDTFLQRWRWPDTPRYAPIKARMLRAFDARDAVIAERDRLKNAGQLTDAGIRDAMRKFVAEKIAPELTLNRKACECLHGRLGAWRDRLKPPPPDRTDQAAAELRREARQILRGMSTAQRIGALMARDVDPIFVAAALEAPKFIDLPPEIVVQLETAHIETTYPEALREIAEVEEAVAHLQAAAGILANDTAQAMGVSNSHEFQKFWTEAVSAKATAIESQAAQLFGKVDAE